MHNWYLWIMNLQKFTNNLYIWISIKHDIICDWLIRINFMCSRNLVHIKVPALSPRYAKWPCQLASSHTATGSFSPETNMFNSGILETVAPSSRNNTLKYQTFSWNPSSFPCSDHELHPKYPCIPAFYSKIDKRLTHFLPNQAPTWT